jgi:hypothetical protein
MNENQKPVNENYRNNYDNIFKKKKDGEQKEQDRKPPSAGS